MLAEDFAGREQTSGIRSVDLVLNPTHWSVWHRRLDDFVDTIRHRPAPSGNRRPGVGPADVPDPRGERLESRRRRTRHEDPGAYRHRDHGPDATGRQMSATQPDPFAAAAIGEASRGFDEGGLPIGSVLVVDGEIVGRGHNRRVQYNSAILHAEMDCLERAGRLPKDVYRRATLYTTLAPCHMCAGAVLRCEIPRVVVGDIITARGAQDHLIAMGVDVEFQQWDECIELMARFIAAKPDVWAEDRQ